MQFYSRRVWGNKARQMQPWTKLTRISSLLREEDANLLSDGGEVTTLGEEFFIPTRSAIMTHEDSYMDDGSSSVMDYYDDEHLEPGNYLIPVKDPFFTVRLRGYRRFRFDKLTDLNTLRRGPKQEIGKALIERRRFGYKPIKERYYVDNYGKYQRGGSLSRGTRGSIEREHSIRSLSKTPSQSNVSRNTESPVDPQRRSGSLMFNDFVDHRSDYRYTGEGLAPIIREKLKDTYFLVGSTVSLRCRIEGNPMPRTVWYLNDRLIIGDDARVKFSQTEEGVITFCITKLELATSVYIVV